MLARGRCGSLSPIGPVSMPSVMSCASCTDAGGAATMNSTRAAGGSLKCFAGISRPGCAPSCELTGTPSMATNCMVWGTPSNTYCRSRMVSADELETLQSCRSPACICSVAGTKFVTPGSPGERTGTWFKVTSQDGMLPPGAGSPGTSWSRTIRIRWRRPLTAGCTFSIPSTTIAPATPPSSACSSWP